MFCKTVAALKYEFPADSALKAFKFNGQLHYAPAFASLLLPLLKHEFADADALLPVPLHRWRHARRGFNQAAEIAKLLARASGLPMLRTIERIRATSSQSGLDAAERRRNLKGAFALRKPLSCRHPVIVTMSRLQEKPAPVVGWIEAGADRSVCWSLPARKAPFTAGGCLLTPRRHSCSGTERCTPAPRRHTTGNQVVLKV
jgi:hypothetical protein